MTKFVNSITEVGTPENLKKSNSNKTWARSSNRYANVTTSQCMTGSKTTRGRKKTPITHMMTELIKGVSVRFSEGDEYHAHFTVNKVRHSICKPDIKALRVEVIHTILAGSKNTNAHVAGCKRVVRKKKPADFRGVGKKLAMAIDAKLS